MDNVERICLLVKDKFNISDSIGTFTTLCWDAHFTELHEDVRVFELAGGTGAGKKSQRCSP